MKIFNEDTIQMFGLAAGFIAIFLIACFVVSTCIDRSSRNVYEEEKNAPITQSVPYATDRGSNSVLDYHGQSK